MSPSPAHNENLPATVARPRRRWLRVLLTVVIFASGLVVGAGLATIGMRNTVLHVLHHPEEAPAKIADRLKHSLRLTPAQTQQVEAILRAKQSRLQAIRVEVQPRVMKELSQLEAEIADVLDPSQRARWHADCQKQRETWVPAMPDESPAHAP